jgi:hypothetical protein
VREGTDSARQFPDGNHCAGTFDARDVASEFRMPERQFEAERHRLGMYTVRTPDHRRPPMFFGPYSNGLHQAAQILEDDIARFAHLKRLRGVDDVG